MNAPDLAFPVDRKLHAISRGLLTALGTGAGVLLLIWLAESFFGESSEARDATWFISGAIRIGAFFAMSALSFLATYRTQPREPRRELARPGPASLRLRVVAAVCAALFFGDFAASAMANWGGGAPELIQLVLLALLALAAAVSVALGRATLRLWKAGGEGVMPVWREPSELQVNRQIPSFGPQTLWLGVFLVAWLLGDAIPPLVPTESAAAGASISLTLEAVLVAAVLLLHHYARELALARRWVAWRRRLVRGAMSVFGFLLSGQLGGRVLMGREQMDTFDFWLGILVAGLGAAAALLRLSPLTPRRSGPPE